MDSTNLWYRFFQVFIKFELNKIFELAVYHEQMEVFNELLVNRANIDAKDNLGWTVLMSGI